MTGDNSFLFFGKNGGPGKKIPWATTNFMEITGFLIELDRNRVQGQDFDRAGSVFAKVKTEQNCFENDKIIEIYRKNRRFEGA